MNNTLIYIDGQLADLSADTFVATTLQSMPIGDIKSRAITHTNRITLPVTGSNNRIYEHANNEASKTRKPYSLVEIKVVQNGIEIIPKGLGLLKESDGRYYHLEIYSAMKQLFDALNGKYVDDIDLEFYGPFDADFIDTFNSAQTPGSCPVIDYGRMLVPQIEITNSNFRADIFEPWENAPDDTVFGTDGQPWAEMSGGYIGVELQDSSPTNTSKYLQGAYEFRKDVEYRIIIELEVLSGTTNASISANLQRDVDIDVSQSGESLAINAVGTYYYDKTIIPELDFNMIAITATHTAGSTTKQIRLLNIKIEPQNVIDVKPPYYLPTLNYYLIITKIIENAGFDLDRIFSVADGAFLDGLHITFSKPELRYNSRLFDKYKCRALVSGDQVINVTDAASATVEFTEVEFNGSAEWYDPADSHYSVPVIGFDLGIRIFVRITVNVTSLSTDGLLSIELSDGIFPLTDDAGIAIGYSITTIGEHTFSLTLPTRYVGDQIRDISVQAITAPASSSATVQILEGYFYVEIDDKPAGRIHASNLILPDMMQRDFFADFLYRFGCLIKEDGTKVFAKPLQNIIEDRATAKDWTGKRDLSVPEAMIYIHNSYGKINYFSDTPSSNPDAKGEFTIDNYHLPEEKTIYTSPFMAPEYITVDGMRVCRVPIFDTESDDPLKVSDKFKPGVRLVYLRDDLNNDPPVKYNGEDEDTQAGYMVAVYDDPYSIRKSNWQYFIDNFYSNLATYLQNTKIITRYYRLSVIDIASLDFTKLIYDSGAYFKIEKVHAYVPGQRTKVELFKVS